MADTLKAKAGEVVGVGVSLRCNNISKNGMSKGILTNEKITIKILLTTFKMM